MTLERTSFMQDRIKGYGQVTRFSDVMDQKRTFHVAQRVKGMPKVSLHLSRYITQKYYQSKFGCFAKFLLKKSPKKSYRKNMHYKAQLS